MTEDGTTPQVTEQAPPVEHALPPEQVLPHDQVPSREQISSHGPDKPFVVGVDRDTVLRRREVVRTVERRGAFITLVLGVVGVAAALYAMFAFDGAVMLPYALLLILAMSPLLLSTWMVFRIQKRRTHWYDANELPPVAMRISVKGLELACDGAAYPVVLPWNTVRGFRQQKLLGQYTLDIALARGVGATTAGVRGLDQPSVRSVVKPNPLLRPTGMFLVKALDQPVHVIDEALKHFSGGTAGVVR
ncbi:hypothetical protein PWY87_22995 [Kribbella solani]|uniref:hypothetical protein n=1 Tax=Kribbella solani TaxID=236067 RepID=UPI0029A5716C|nr:hypothetical protein [Kribbella solani]MDX2971252.1 hypothetical protein [Kribbella solani]MDX3004575.1 hypothetical protein [Kribbella solani]